MRILRLTADIEKELLAARQTRDLEAERAASTIVAEIRQRGDAALFEFVRKFDNAGFRGKDLRIGKKQIRAARKRVPEDFLSAIRHASRNIRAVAERQLPKAWKINIEPGVLIRQRVVPIESIGCYIPGGRFALVSTLLMTVIPARVAGVPEIIVVCPKPNDELLAAADFLGISEILRIGGAQAIAALAYGTESVPRVEKIFGPGNRFVTAAKQIVSSDCAIDLPAGPTEAIVLADSGNASWIAADLLAQAEHAPDAGSFLVTTSAKFGESVAQEVAVQLRELPETNPAHQSMTAVGAVVVASSQKAACEFINRFAPEHLSLPSASRALLTQINSAGTIFTGPCGAQPFGDYVSGSNHVLPTGGWARSRGGLSTADFVKCSTVQEISRTGMKRLAASAEVLATTEGLLAHRNAVSVRR
ncbi:MAG TPA: histidinol dehydrogenase [Candidatus Dormibacteraeota bacterium]|jgi:histidinol dehydrogenase|nr:histidinol dehydrogenase [Candidatus Dormibacteraeota bacterium]